VCCVRHGVAAGAWSWRPDGGKHVDEQLCLLASIPLHHVKVKEIMGVLSVKY